MTFGLVVIFLIVSADARGPGEWIPILITVLCLAGFVRRRWEQPHIRAELRRMVLELKGHCQAAAAQSSVTPPAAASNAASKSPRPEANDRDTEF